MINLPVVKSGVPIKVILIDSFKYNVVNAILQNETRADRPLKCKLINISSVGDNPLAEVDNISIFDVTLSCERRGIVQYDKAGYPVEAEVLEREKGTTHLTDYYEVYCSINAILPEGLYRLDIEQSSYGIYLDLFCYPFIVDANTVEDDREFYRLCSVLQSADKSLMAYNLGANRRIVNMVESEVLHGIDLKVRDAVLSYAANAASREPLDNVQEFIEGKVNEIVASTVPPAISDYLSRDQLAFVKRYIKDSASDIIKSYIDEVVPNSMTTSVAAYESRLYQMEQEMNRINRDYRSSTVYISDDGYWVINGSKTTIKAKSDVVSEDKLNSYTPLTNKYVIVNTDFNSDTTTETHITADISRDRGWMNGVGINYYWQYNPTIILDKSQLIGKNGKVYVKYRNQTVYPENVQAGKEIIIRYKRVDQVEYNKVVPLESGENILEFDIRDINSNVLLIFNKAGVNFQMNINLPHIRFKEDNATHNEPIKRFGSWLEKPVAPAEGTTYVTDDVYPGNNVMLTYYNSAWHTIWGARIDGSLDNAKLMYEIALNKIISK